MYKVIKLRLAELLKKKGLDKSPLRELANQIGIDHVSLWKMKEGKPYNPSLLTLDRLCHFLKCKPSDLLEFKRNKN